MMGQVVVPLEPPELLPEAAPLDELAAVAVVPDDEVEVDVEVVELVELLELAVAVAEAVDADEVVAAEPVELPRVAAPDEAPELAEAIVLACEVLELPPEVPVATAVLATVATVDVVVELLEPFPVPQPAEEVTRATATPSAKARESRSKRPSSG
jgi:hypothetical protein